MISDRARGGLLPDVRRTEEHVMRATEFERIEIQLELWLQLLAIPGIGADELLVVRALFVPMREERAAEVEPLPVPALRHHVDLLADGLLVNLLRLLRIRHVKDAALAVAEATHEECAVIGAQADVHRKHATLAADGRDFLRLPLALAVLVAEPELGRERGGGEGMVVVCRPGPPDF